MTDPPKAIKLPGKFKGETVVYLAYGPKNVLMYVGIADDFYKRMGQHAAKSAWWPYLERFEVEVYETRSKAMVREAQLVRDRVPSFNKALQGPKRRQQIRESEEWFARPGCVICDDPAELGSDKCAWHLAEERRPPEPVISSGPRLGPSGRRYIGETPEGFDARKVAAYRRAMKAQAEAK